MLNNFVLNYVILFLFMSLQMCLNVEDETEEYGVYDKKPVMNEKGSSSNNKAREKTFYATDSNLKNNNNTKYKFKSKDEQLDDIDYISEIYNETDEDTCDLKENWTSKRLTFFKPHLFAEAKPHEEVEEDCNDCIPGLLTGDVYEKSNGIVKDINKQDFALKIESKKKNKLYLPNRVSYPNETIPPVLLNRKDADLSNVSSNNKIHEPGDLRPKEPYLRVVNGRAAKLGEVPYQVAFKMLRSRVKNDYITFCGGVIIGPSKLVSAAHCFESGRKPMCRTSGSRKATKKTLQRTQVVAGNLRNIAVFDDSGQWRKLKSMYYPVKYKFPKNDISVGFTTRPFTFNSHVNSVPYQRNYVEYDGVTCLVSGYGRINKRELSDKLLVADLTLVNNEVCSKVHRLKMKKFICTRGVPSDIEKGDSGGPLVCSGVLVGIVSGHRYGAGSFFTRVSAHSKYIERGNATTLSLYCFINYFIYILIVIFTI